MVVGWCDAGTTILFSNVEKDSSKNLDIRLFRLQTEKMKTVYEAFSKTPMTVDSFSDTRVLAHVDMKKDGVLFTTIAAEEGWELYVDGERVEYDDYQDAYISTALKAGKHELEFRFSVPWFTQSLILTIIAGLIFVWIYIRYRIIRKQKAANAGRDASSGEPEPIRIMEESRIPIIEEPAFPVESVPEPESVTPAESAVEPESVTPEETVVVPEIVTPDESAVEPENIIPAETVEEKENDTLSGRFGTDRWPKERTGRIELRQEGPKEE